jgi:hypothetical protein
VSGDEQDIRLTDQLGVGQTDALSVPRGDQHRHDVALFGRLGALRGDQCTVVGFQPLGMGQGATVGGPG